MPPAQRGQPRSGPGHAESARAVRRHGGQHRSYEQQVALCAEQVPCGAAAKKAQDAAGLKVTPVSFEQDVKATLTKVELGEADAALVYKTDVLSSAG